MNISSFKIPTEIIYGFNSIKNLGEIVEKLKVKRVLIITDRGVVAAGLIKNVVAPLEDFSVKYDIFEEVEPNPSVETVNKCMELFEKVECEAVIAVGGGSPLDVGKAVGVLAANGGSITDYEGVDKVAKHPIPVIAIPTTSGTASEVTINIVITDHSRNYKLTIVSKNSAARYAILDPMLTVSMPAGITAATGLDALVHAIESYTSLMAYPISEAVALESIRLISSNLSPAVFNGSNLAARDAMLMGSLMAGIAFNNTRLGNAHAMSHPLSAYFNIPHGVANAILIPHIMEFNLPAIPEKFIKIAEAMGETVEGLNKLDAAMVAVKAVKRLNDDIGIPQTLTEVGAKKDIIKEMAQDAMKSGNILINPRQTKIEDIISLYEKAY